VEVKKKVRTSISVPKPVNNKSDLIFPQNLENISLLRPGSLLEFPLLKGFLDLFEIVLQPKKSSM
jgi:hypothetical protein